MTLSAQSLKSDGNPLDLLRKDKSVAVFLPCTHFCGSLLKTAHTEALCTGEIEQQMTQDNPLPPYFNIHPDSALDALGAPATTADFGTIARACEAGRADLSSRGLEEGGRRSLRLFSTWKSPAT